MEKTKSNYSSKRAKKNIFLQMIDLWKKDVNWHKHTKKRQESLYWVWPLIFSLDYVRLLLACHTCYNWACLLSSPLERFKCGGVDYGKIYRDRRLCRTQDSYKR